jgi:SAM-dependent methyltransferase
MQPPRPPTVQFWNDVLVPKFTRFRRILVDGGAPHSAFALANNPPCNGARVLDIGCGFGETTIELARRAGPTGEAIGIDCCEAFLEHGRRDAADAAVGNARFQALDAQRDELPREINMCFSRFGTMFFDQPGSAMRNLRRAMRRNGRLVMLTWRDLEDNDWLRLAKRVARRHLPAPHDDAPSCGPGPFSMSDPDAVTTLLESAGFTDVRLARYDCAIYIGADVDEAIAFQLEIGPAGEIVRDAGERGEAARPRIAAALRDSLAGAVRPGGVYLGSSSWCVTAVAA